MFYNFFFIYFLSSFLQQYSSSLFTWLTTILTVALTALGLFINNRYSEKNKIEREKKELAKFIIGIVKNHLHQINELKKIELNCTIIEDYKSKEIDKYLDSIKNDMLFQNALLKVSCFDLKILLLILEYSQDLNWFTSQLHENFDRNRNSISLNFASSVNGFISIIIINCDLLIMILSKFVVDEKQEYKKSKESIIKEVKFICNKYNILILEDFTVKPRSIRYGTWEVRTILEKVIRIFGEMSIKNELTEN